MKTLVIREGAVGDTILTLHAAQWLGELGHDMDVMLEDKRLALAGLFGFPAVSARLSSLDSVYTEPDERLKKVLSPFDLIIAIKADPDGSLEKALSKAAGGRVVRIDPLPPEGWSASYPMFLIRLIAAALNTSPPAVIPPLVPRAGWAPPEKPRLFIHPGSGSPRKNWPAERFFEVMEEWALNNPGGEVVIALGYAEEGIADDFIKRAVDGVRVIRNQPMPAIARELSRASVYIGMDSGITHLAAALGVPTVALFGPTDMAVWGPIGERVMVIESPGNMMNGIGAQEVERGILTAAWHSGTLAV